MRERSLHVCVFGRVCLCLRTLTVIRQEIPISVWNNLVIIGPVVQSTYFFLLIWTLPRFKLGVITSHVDAALHSTILCGSSAGAKGIETKTEGGEEEEGAEVETQPADSFLHMIASLSKHL